MPRLNPAFKHLQQVYARRQQEQAKRIDWALVTPESFVSDPDFCDLAISDAQRALVRASAGLPVTHLDPLDLEYHLGTRGPFEPPRKPKVIACRSGRRSGKSLIAMLLLALHALTAPLRRPPEPHETPERDGLVGVSKGERVRLAVVAARMSQSIGTFQLMLSRIEQSPKLSRYLTSKGVTSATFTRDDGQEVRVEILAASPRGTNLRGGWFIGAVLDESDFFGEEDANVNLDDQISAVRPALVRGGQIWLCTSPWDESGQFATLHNEAFGKPDDVVAFHSSTQRMNPTCDLEDIERQRQKDPDFVSREYDAVPMTAGTDAWFSEAEIVAACTRDEPFKVEPTGAPHYGGCDPGLRKNSAALALARPLAGRVSLSYYEELIPTRKSPEQALEDRKRGIPPGLAPSFVFRSFAETALRYGAASIKGDQWYEDSAIEHMPTVKNEAGDSVWYDTVEDNAKTTAELFTAFKALMSEGLLDLPRDPRLIQQLKDTKRRKGANGAIAVSLPKTGAAHGDLLKSIVLACTQVPLIQAAGSDFDVESDSRWTSDRGF